MKFLGGCFVVLGAFVIVILLLLAACTKITVRGGGFYLVGDNSLDSHPTITCVEVKPEEYVGADYKPTPVRQGNCCAHDWGDGKAPLFCWTVRASGETP